MRKHLRFYFETSIWRTLVDATDPRRKITYRLTTLARRRHLILASREVVNELDEVPDLEVRRSALRRLRRVGVEMIPVRLRILHLADELLRRGGWGGRDLEDMLHIGYAMVGEADVLVTWDTSDLAREKTRRIVRILAREEELKAPDIATPKEVLEEWLGEKTV